MALREVQSRALAPLLGRLTRCFSASALPEQVGAGSGASERLRAAIGRWRSASCAGPRCPAQVALDPQSSSGPSPQLAPFSYVPPGRNHLFVPGRFWLASPTGSSVLSAPRSPTTRRPRS
jgi:hypothetical protein